MTTERRNEIAQANASGIEMNRTDDGCHNCDAEYARWTVQGIPICEDCRVEARLPKPLGILEARVEGISAPRGWDSVAGGTVGGEAR